MFNYLCECYANVCNVFTIDMWKYVTAVFDRLKIVLLSVFEISFRPILEYLKGIC